MDNDMLASQSGAYLVCVPCKEGRIESRHDAQSFQDAHLTHGNLTMVPEAIFLSDHLTKQYIDIDRPDMEPIKLHMGGAAPAIATKMPFGAPSAASAMATQKKMSADHAKVTHSIEAEEVMPQGPIPVPITMRPTFDETWLCVAEVISRRGTCSRLKVGAALVRENRIISTGYNGAPSGLRHCNHTDNGDMTDGHCNHAEHAERNALLFAGREARGGTMYLTVSPCLACCRMMVTAGVSRIVYRGAYRHSQEVNELCASAGIDLNLLVGVTSPISD